MQAYSAGFLRSLAVGLGELFYSCGPVCLWYQLLCDYKRSGPVKYPKNDSRHSALACISLKHY